MNTEEFDDLDIGILRELRTNCKMPMRTLAEKLKSHPNTIMQRIKILEKKGVIKGYKASIDYKKLGYDMYALTFLRVEKTTRARWDLLSDLKKFPEVVTAHALTGTYDVVMLIRTKNSDTLAHLIKRINQIPYIAESQTSLLLETFKHTCEFNPLLNEGRNP